MACKCQNCGNKFKMDLLIPDKIWKQIMPSGNNGEGLLCPACIVNKIEELYEYCAFRLINISPKI